jgi:hypothetical protein
MVATGTFPTTSSNAIPPAAMTKLLDLQAAKFERACTKVLLARAMLNTMHNNKNTKLDAVDTDMEERKIYSKRECVVKHSNPD